MRPVVAGGSNQNSIMFEAEENLFQAYVYYYNEGKIFRIQPYFFYPALSFHKIKYKFGRFYILSSYDVDFGYFVIAKLKSNKFN